MRPGILAFVMFLGFAAAAHGTPADQLRIESAVSAPDNLSSVTVHDLENDASFKVLFDASSEQTARESIPTLATFYRQLSDLLALDPAQVHWSNVLFAQDAENLVLTKQAGNTVWKIDVGANGELSEEGIKFLYSALPHEQVHATQPDGLPRWYAEGQAEWAGLQVTTAWDARLAAQRRAVLAEALAKTGPSVALGRWGGVQIKPEAILRQLTPEQRAQFQEDPASVPLTGISFGPDDLVSDESNTQARYGASLALFERIDAAAGRAGLHAWFEAARQTKQPDSKYLLELAQQTTDVDIAKDIE